MSRAAGAPNTPPNTRLQLTATLLWTASPAGASCTYLESLQLELHVRPAAGDVATRSKDQIWALTSFRAIVT
jgi:hypothetical protein